MASAPPRAPTAAVDRDAWRNTPPEAGPPAAFEYPLAQRATLDNGMTVLFQHQDTPLLTVNLVIRHGAGSDTVGKSGRAALTGRMLVEETRGKDSLALAEAAESLGGELDASTDYDHTSVSFEFLRDDIKAGFDLLAEVVASPRFSSKVFERVRNEWLDTLRAERQEPTQLASIAGMRALLGNEIGAPPDGSLADVGKLTSADLREAHERFYEPSSAALVVVGGARFEDVVEHAKAAFSRWKARPKDEAARPNPTPKPEASHALIVDRPGAVQSALFVALRFPPRGTEGFERRELLNQVLGGMFTSRLNQNLRERNAFTYGAASAYRATREFGVWQLGTSVRADHTGPALREILVELEAIRTSKPVTRSELERAKQELLGRYSAHLERSAEIDADLSTLFVERLKLDYLARLGDTIEAISLDEVQREAERFLSIDALTVVVVGDRARVQNAVAQVFEDVREAPAELLD